MTAKTTSKMNKDKIFIEVDLADPTGDFLAKTKLKISKKEYEKSLIICAEECERSYTLAMSKKSRKTKDIKSFKSSDYEMFKNGYFNCNNIPYGYNFLLGRCMEPVTFEPKRKER